MYYLVIYLLSNNVIPSHSRSSSWEFIQPYQMVSRETSVLLEYKNIHASCPSLTVTGTWQRFLTLGDMGVSSEQFRK
jgi:hypothetical protein